MYYSGAAILCKYGINWWTNATNPKNNFNSGLSAGTGIFIIFLLLFMKLLVQGF